MLRLDSKQSEEDHVKSDIPLASISWRNFFDCFNWKYFLFISNFGKETFERIKRYQ